MSFLKYINGKKVMDRMIKYLKMNRLMVRKAMVKMICVIFVTWMGLFISMKTRKDLLKIFDYLLTYRCLAGRCSVGIRWPGIAHMRGGVLTASVEHATLPPIGLELQLPWVVPLRCM